ncbi:hypothetical protein F4779DRAFT_587968 [Xylariaceae sp. FL0662B]|nr:hypothetical protein F4779DRAFT_587968 [Xylariaceae sp. FL0662B]
MSSFPLIPIIIYRVTHILMPTLISVTFGLAPCLDKCSRYVQSFFLLHWIRSTAICFQHTFHFYFIFLFASPMWIISMQGTL